MENLILFLCMITTNLSNLWYTLEPIIMYLLKLFDIHMFRVYNRDSINILKNLFVNDICTHYDEDHIPYGLIIPKSLEYIAYVYDDNHSVLCILTTRSHFTKMMVRNHTPVFIPILEDDKSSSNELQYWNRSGNYSYLSYHKRAITISHEFNTKQEEIYKNVMSIYNKKNNVKCFIHGDSDVGKTMFAYIMAKKIGGSLCDTFNPTEPSDSFDNLYTTINPTSKCPLVLLMDEVDIMLRKIHDTIPSTKLWVISVHNKTTWNLMLDKIDYGLYPFLILILCSNKSYKEIQSLDPSYLRKGRIDLVEYLR